MNSIFSIEDLLKTAQSNEFVDNFNRTLDYLNKKEKVVFITTSNRYQFKGAEKETPKSTQIAIALSDRMKKKPEIVNVDSLKIYMCEANISRSTGNNCGAKDSAIKDKDKNPTGNHRCWASINNKDDELWKVSRPLLDSDCSVFFSSIRWGQACGLYQKLIERLSWIENIHVTLNEKNFVKDIETGFICTGHNWRGADVVKVQKQVLSFFGFKTPDPLFWNWQWTKDAKDEEIEHYKQDSKDFEKLIKLTIKGKEANEGKAK
jgi:hypothetical protein